MPVPESARIIRDAEKKAKKIIAEAEKLAKNKAKKIIDDAESIAKKEAKERIRLRADELMEQVRQESDHILTQTKELADREKSNVVNAYKARMEQMLMDITAQFRKDTQLCSMRIITTAKEKADEILSEVRSAGKEAIKNV